jgi:hypothetical protein
LVQVGLLTQVTIYISDGIIHSTTDLFKYSARYRKKVQGLSAVKEPEEKKSEESEGDYLSSHF